ncbi:hypothetical protein Bbelb_289180 [Branchiostoma belcheri]|nr:hypothetical protein Bbelb_289180 [Branchiostoma belcheri]
MSLRTRLKTAGSCGFKYGPRDIARRHIRSIFPLHVLDMSRTIGPTIFPPRAVVTETPLTHAQLQDVLQRIPKQHFICHVNSSVSRMRVTLQTFHYSTNAEKLVDYDGIAPLKVRKYLRPGAPMAGLVTYAKMDGVWQMVGWVPEKEKSAVVEMCGGAPETLHVLLEDAYIKRGYNVIKVDLSV